MAKQNIKDPGAHHNSSGALIRRFLPYLAKHKAVLFLDLFCAALTTLCDIFLPKIMSTITNSAMGVGITLTTGIVLKLAGIYFVLRIIDGAAQYFMSGIGHIMGVHIETDMRRDAFDHLLLLDHTYYNNTKVGTIMGRITNDLFDVTEFAHHCPEEFFIAFIKILASFIILCQASIPLTLAVFACVPLMGVVSVYLNGRLRARFRQQRIQIGELNATIEDSLLGQGVVKAFAAEEQERAKFEQGNKDFEHIKTLGYYAMAAFNTSTRLFDGLMYLVVILAGGLSLVNGKITAGDLVAYMLYVTTLIATIRRIVEFAEQFQRGMTGIERFAEIMDTPVPIHDAPDAKPLQPGPGAIRFDDVSFEYPDDHNKVLHHVSLDIKAGERLALVGPSGGGKTTLCNLIPRFYDVTSGHIYIDGQDIQQVTLKSLREDIGIVQQDVYLFSGSVADNIAYGKPDATREEIDRSCPSGRCRALYHGPEGRLRHLCRRAWCQALGRPEAAHRHCPGVPEEPAHPDPGRGHQCTGQRERDPCGAEPGKAGPWPHHPDHCPPPDHHQELRPYPGAWLRGHCGIRHSRRAAGKAGRVLPPVEPAAR